MTTEEITDILRYRVVGLLHVGRIGHGDRLPSIRETSGRLDADHRAVAEAYRRLAEEGLVEVRPASGVYVAGKAAVEAGIASDLASWVARLLEEGWLRGVPRGAVGELVARCTTARVRCACLESVEDHMEALAVELEESFELEVDRVRLDHEAGDEALVDRLRSAHLVVALQFHGARARELARRADVPAVIVGINPELVEAVDDVLRRGPVTAVFADPGMAERAEAHLGVTDHAGAVHPVLASSLESLEEAEAAGRPVLATRAARRLLGAEDYHLVPPPTTLVSPRSARELFEVATRVALATPVESGDPS